MLTYNAHELLNIGYVYLKNSKCKINTHLWRKLGDIGIKKPVRGCRGGQYKRNDKNCNINHTVVNQIKPVQPVGGCRVGLNKRKNKNSNVNHTALNPNKSIRNKIKIGYCNARSVCNKTTDIQLFIKDHNLDVLTITETWLPHK